MFEQQVYELLEVMPDPLILMREDGTIAFANEQALKLLGYSARELVGLRLDAIVPERFRDRHKEASTAYFARPVVRPMGNGQELSALCRNGREVPVDISLSPIRTTSGLLVAASLHDISDRREEASKLRGTLAELEVLRDRLEAENHYLRDEAASDAGFDEFVGQSDLLKLLLKQINQVAATDVAVLILGETGTGKELVARAIHARSRRRDGPLIRVNCAALPSSLIESALFGHEKGAFTGAVRQEPGRFELAHCGTIFLDEIGEMHSEMQAKLLRVLQEGEFERVGSARSQTVDVRVIAATNTDLQKAMRENRFRPDLYFRLAVFPIQVPSLRARREDIPLLVRHIISRKQTALGKRIVQIPEPTMDGLMRYSWPGNIRELENVVERAIILSPDTTLIVESLSDAVELPVGPSAANSGVLGNASRDHILAVLEKCRWRIKGPSGAASRLGMNPSTLRYRMKKLGIER